MEKLIENMLNAKSLQAYEKTSNALNNYFLSATESEKVAIREAHAKKGAMILEETRESSKVVNEIIAEFYQTNTKTAIEVNDKKYPLDEWLTIKEYCKQFDVKNTMIVSNWIKRKVIPEENVLLIRKLNNLKLIKAVPYMK